MNTKEKKEFNIQFWRFLWASTLIGLSACLGNVVDAMIVGNLIDEDAVSAINLSLPFIQFMFTVNMLLATGAGMLVGMELGKQDTRRASYIFVISMSACLLTGLVLTACGVLIPDVVTRLLCNHEQLYQPTYEYLRATLIGAPAYLLMWGIDTMVSVDGSPRLVSVSILVDNVVHLVLDVVFIKYFGWGIEGSAWAAVIGHVVGLRAPAAGFRRYHLAGRTAGHCLHLSDSTDVCIQQDHIVIPGAYRNLCLCPLYEPAADIQPVPGRRLPNYPVAGLHPGG